MEYWWNGDFEVSNQHLSQNSWARHWKSVQNYPKSSNVYTLGERKGCSSRQSALTSRQYFATHKQSPTDRADLKASLGKLNKKPRVVYNNVHWEQMGFWTSQQRSYSKRRRLDNPILTYYLHLNVVLLFTLYIPCSPMQRADWLPYE